MSLIIQTVPKLDMTLYLKIKDLLQLAVDVSSDSISLAYVTGLIQSGEALLWVISTETSRGILVTTNISQGKNQALLIWLLAGEAIAQHGKAIQKRLEEFAKDTGCGEIKAVVSNKQLENFMLGNLGYQYGGAVLYKELENEQSLSERKITN